MQGKVVFLLKSRQVDKSTSGQVNKLLVDRGNKRQGNMVSGQVNEWTSEQVACKERQSNMRTSFPL